MSLSCHFWPQKMRYYGSMGKDSERNIHHKDNMYILNGSITR